MGIVVAGAGTPEASPATLWYAVLLGLCGFLVMTVTVQYGVTRMPIHRSAIILLFELVIGALSAMWLTNEVVLVREWIGGGMIIMAAVIAARIHAGETP